MVFVYFEMLSLHAALTKEITASVWLIYEPQQSSVCRNYIQIWHSGEAQSIYILLPLEHLHNLCRQLDWAIDSVSGEMYLQPQ